MHVFPFDGFWGWGWGWAASIGWIISLGILLIPMFFFLLNLSNLLEEVQEHNRAMSPGHVWLNFIPVFNLGWFIYTVTKVRESVRREYAARGWPSASGEDFGYNVGIAAGVLVIVTVVVSFLGWITSIAALICWVLYWVKTSEIKSRLAQEGLYRPSGPYGSGLGHDPTPPVSGPGGPGAWQQGPPDSPPPPPHYPGPSSSGPSFAAGAATGAAAGAAATGATDGAATTGFAADPVSATTDPAGAAASPAGATDDVASEAGSDVTGAGVDADQSTSRCGQCGTPYDDTDRFCRSCGARLSQ